MRLLDEQGQTATGSARLSVDRPGRLVAEVDAPGRRVLAFTERFHDGWSATIDGAPLQTVRVEEDFLGCVVDAGVHRVTLRFMPKSFVYGSILSAIGAALLAGVLFLKLKLREQLEFARSTTANERRVLTLLIAVLLGTAAAFRLVRLSSVPGISGDEAWWGIQATAWVAGRPYDTHTTSGNPIDLVFLVPLALLHAIAPPSFLLLRLLPAFVNLLALPIGFWFVRAAVRQHHRVDLHGGAGDPADRHRAQPHLSGSLPNRVLDGHRHLPVDAWLQGTSTGLEVPRRSRSWCSR